MQIFIKHKKIRQRHGKIIYLDIIVNMRIRIFDQLIKPLVCVFFSSQL